MKVLSRGAAYVYICFCINQIHKCQILCRDDAYRLRRIIEDELGGTVYQFTPA